MNPPTIARSAEEIQAEAEVLGRFIAVYEAIAQTTPDGGVMGHRARGAAAALRWVQGKRPALSETLTRALRGAREGDLR